MDRYTFVGPWGQTYCRSKDYMSFLKGKMKCWKHLTKFWFLYVYLDIELILLQQLIHLAKKEPEIFNTLDHLVIIRNLIIIYFDSVKFLMGRFPAVAAVSPPFLQSSLINIIKATAIPKLTAVTHFLAEFLH